MCCINVMWPIRPKFYYLQVQTKEIIFFAHTFFHTHLYKHQSRKTGDSRQCPDCGWSQVKVDCVRAGVCLGPAVEATPASAPDPSHGQEEDE